MSNVIKPHELSSEQMIEEGVGLIAQGLSRIGNSNLQNKPDIACINAFAIANTMIEIAEEFDKIADEKDLRERQMR